MLLQINLQFKMLNCVLYFLGNYLNDLIHTIFQYLQSIPYFAIEIESSIVEEIPQVHLDQTEQDDNSPSKELGNLLC